MIWRVNVRKPRTWIDNMSVWILVIGQDFYCQLDGRVCLADQISMHVKVTDMDLIARAT
jgi:hypothetical protein